MFIFSFDELIVINIFIQKLKILFRITIALKLPREIPYKSQNECVENWILLMSKMG